MQRKRNREYLRSKLFGVYIVYERKIRKDSANTLQKAQIAYRMLKCLRKTERNGVKININLSKLKYFMNR